MTLEELTTPLTVEQVKTTIYTALQSQGAATTSWKPGAVMRTLIAGLAIVLAALSQLQAAIAKMGILDLAEKDWLTLLARYVYGVERIEGTFASGDVELTNNAGGVYAGAAGDLIVQNTTCGKTYRNTAPYALGAGPGTTITVPVEAVELGSESTSTVGEIDGLVTALSGVTVTNPNTLIGDDEESDPALRQRCRDKLGSLSPMGPFDAYRYAATSARTSDGASAGCTRVKGTADGIGGIDIIVADSTGELAGTIGDLSTALGAVDDAIQKLAAPLGITARVASATPLVIDVTYELWLVDDTGLTDAEIEEEIGNALAPFMSEQPIGGLVISPAVGKVYGSALGVIIGNAVNDDDGRIAGTTIRLAITVPAGDTTVAANEAPVIGTVTGTIHQEPA